MTRQNIPSTVLAVALVIATVSACSAESGPNEAYGHGVYIPQDWQTNRTVDGHYEHVVKRQVACSECHELTQSEIGPAPPVKCAECHEQEARIEHASILAQQRFGAAAKSDCTTCHAFTLDVARETTSSGPVKTHSPGDCARCHLQRQGGIPAVRVHHTEECVSCHQPHTASEPRSAPCDQCHEDVTTTHAATGKDIVDTCSTCHQHLHAFASDARLGCQNCHETQHSGKFDKALFAKGHTECIGCHRPHQFEKSKAVACVSCHEQLRVLGGPRVQAHNNCTNCHNPHDVKSASVAACAGCHSNIKPNHPKHGKAGTCTGCHDPHPASALAKERARNCTSCHHAAAHETDFHGGLSCRNCHAPHQFLLASPGVQLCAECHQKSVHNASTITGHRECNNCHRGLPHRPLALQVGCSTCHRDQRATVAKGHAECQSCHEPHGGAIIERCKDCHAAVHRTAPAGHRFCADCHHPHSGSTTRATCSSCHAAQANTPHGKLRSSCRDCHRPHGPEGTAKPPGCTSCHQGSDLFGLHAHQQHRNCSTCHGGHGDALALRHRCLECHGDKTEHYPTAQTCAGCHLFVKTR